MLPLRISGWKATLSIAALALSATPAWALPIWGSSGLGELTGSRNSGTDGGVYATKSWANGGFNISWDISFDDDTDLWTYQYHVTVPRKEVSHWLLEVTQDSDSVLIDGSSSEAVAPTTYTSTSNGNSNPLLPNPIYGVKFDYGDLDEVYTLVTDRAPVYGVFYAKDGKDGGQDVVAWSTALSSADYKTNESLTATSFIVRPNGKHVNDPDPDPDPDPNPDPDGNPTPNPQAVPEPMSAGLSMISALALAVGTWRRRRR
jgi:hypothetical protein